MAHATTKSAIPARTSTIHFSPDYTNSQYRLIEVSEEILQEILNGNGRFVVVLKI